MSNGNTETRILEMQLENKDFEDGVRKTIQSLESLEEKLNLKNAGDGFEKISAAANSVQMSHLESGIDAVTNKFTLMGQIGLQVLENISSKIVNTSERILRAATIQPMIDGWSEFEMKTGSVQTILGGIRNQFDDQPTAIHAISEALDELNEYADKTIYNFAQMTENVGKFTNQGISLADSTNAIKGIANWAAAVGANPQQMSRAMYNISQSLGAGSMQLIDWRSIRFANMATPEVKKLFAEVAKKRVPELISQEGKVKFGKKEFDVMEDFEGSLKAGWLTNEVMTEAFSIYAKAYSQEELIAEYGEDLGNQFYEMGVYAEEAATKVRTFTQLIGVLKESLGSGWAQTFDILLGGFEKQTEFLTNIKSIIEGIIDFQTRDRNTWLENFSNIGGIKVFQDVILQTLDILTDFYWVFNDVAALIFNPFGSSVFNMSDGIFGPRQEGYVELRNTWEGVKSVFDDISRTLSNFKNWLYMPSAKTGRSPIHNLANALSGVAGAAGIAWQVLTGFGKFVFRIFKRFEPLVSSVLDLLGQIGGAIYNVFFNLTGQGSVDKIFDKIEGAIGPVIDVVVGLATAVVDLLHSFLGIDAAANDWTVLGERMKDFWKIFEYDPELTFFENLQNSVRWALNSIFGREAAMNLIAGWDNNVAPVLEQICTFFTDAFDTISKEVESAWNGITDFLFGHEITGKQGNTWREGGLAQTISEFFGGNQWEEVKASIHSAIDPITTELGYALNDAVNAIFGHEVIGKQGNTWREGGLVQTISDFFGGSQWEEVKATITTTFDSITSTLESAWNNVVNAIFGHEITGKRGNTWREGGLVQTIQSLFEGDSWSAIQTAFDDLTKKLSDAWTQLSEFLFGHEVIGKQGNTWREGGAFNTIIDFFNSQDWAATWETIKTAFEDIYNWVVDTGETAWNAIMTFLFGPEIPGKQGSSSYRTGGAYDEALTFLNPVFDWLKEKGEYLYDYLTTHNFEDMWRGLNTLLFGYDTTVMTGPGQSFTKHTDGVLDPMLAVLQPIADMFEKIKGWALEKLSGIDFGGIWEAIGKFFSGYDEYVYLEGKGYGYTVHHDSLFEKIAGFFERVIEFFNRPEVQSFLGTIERVLGWIGGLGGELWGAVERLFGGEGLGAFEGVGNYISDGFNKLMGSIFPEGSDLGGMIGGLLGWNASDTSGTTNSTMSDAAKSVQDAIAQDDTGGFFGWLLNLFMGKASADEAAIEETASGVVATLENTGEEVKKTSDAGTKTTTSILDSIKPFLPYIAGAGALGLVGKVGDMITGITGKRKPTIIEQIAMLLNAFAEPLKGLALSVAAAGFAEWISPGAIDQLFSHMKTLLDTIFGWLKELGLWGMGGGLFSMLFTGISSWKINGEFEASGSNMNLAMVLGSIGEAFKSLMEGMQTLFGLSIEIMAADALMDEKLPDGTVVHHLDERIQRVLDFVKDVIVALTFNWGTGLAEVFTLADTVVEGKAAATAAKEGNKNFKSNNGIGQTLIGIATIAGEVLDGIAAIMTASIIPGVLNFDTSKIVDIINAVFNGLSLLIGISGGEGVISQAIQAWKGGTGIFSLAKLGAAVDIFVVELSAGIGAAMFILGSIANVLVDEFAKNITDNMEAMAPRIYTFGSNVAGALEALGSVTDDVKNKAIGVVTEDLPETFKTITSNDSWFDKAAIEERGAAIRDFGNRVKIGLGGLAAAKEAFDKYNTGDDEDGFPLVFFKSLTAALEYLNQNGIKELYDEFFKTGFGDEYTPGDERGINSLTGFFSSIGTIGSVLTETNDFWGKQEKLVSAKEGFDAFSEAFSSIQDTFKNLVGNMNQEGFSVEKMDALTRFIVELGKVGTAFVESTEVIHQMTDGSIMKYHEQTSMMSQLGAWIESTGRGIRDLDTALKNNEGQYDIDYTQLENALNAIKPMADIAVQINELDKNGFRLEDLAYDMNVGHNTNFAAGLTGFLEQIGSAEIDAGIAKANSILPSISGFIAGIGEVMRVQQETGDRNGFTTALSEILSAISGQLDTVTTEKVDKYATSLQNLKESLIVDGGNTTSIATMIQQVFDNIGDKEVKLKITPIIDDTSFKSAFDLPEGVNVGNEYSRNITLNVNMNDIQKVEIIDSQIESLVAANRETRDKLDGLSSAIGRIRLQINLPPVAFGGRNGGNRSVEVYPLVANYQEDFT